MAGFKLGAIDVAAHTVVGLSGNECQINMNQYRGNKHICTTSSGPISSESGPA